MTPFQWIACTVLGLAALRELVRVRHRATTPPGGLTRTGIWLLALFTIARPDLVQRFANAIGIGRGADVVLYVFVLAFLGTAFFLYSRQVRLQRQLNSLVSHLAITEARRGSESSPAPER